jgi:hypothetical protein
MKPNLQGSLLVIGVVTSVAGTALFWLAGKVIEALGGVPPAIDYVMLAVVIVIITLMIVFVVGAGGSGSGARDVPVPSEDAGTPGLVKQLPISPLRLSLISSVLLLILLSVVFYPVLPLFHFLALVLLAVLNFFREFFSVHFVSKEIVDKLIDQILATFHAYCRSVLTAELGNNLKPRVRTNIMLIDDKHTTLWMFRRCNMVGSTDREFSVPITKGIAGRAFGAKTAISADATDPKFWGFNDDEIAKLPHDLCWVWSNVIVDENDEPIGVLNADVNKCPIPDRANVYLTTLVHDFAQFVSLANHLRPKR